MSHVTDYHIFEAKNDKDALKKGFAWATDFAAANVDRQENPSGMYTSSFEFRTHTPFFLAKDAMTYFNDKGSYYDGVVPLYYPSDKIVEKYISKQTDVLHKIQDFWNKRIKEFEARISATIGCKWCGKRIKKEDYNIREVYYEYNNPVYAWGAFVGVDSILCPNCGEPLLSYSNRERLDNMKTKLKPIDLWYKNECIKKNKTRYLAKAEVHC